MCILSLQNSNSYYVQEKSPEVHSIALPQNKATALLGNAGMSYYEILYVIHSSQNEGHNANPSQTLVLVTSTRAKERQWTPHFDSPEAQVTFSGGGGWLSEKVSCLANFTMEPLYYQHHWDYPIKEVSLFQRYTVWYTSLCD